MITFPVMPGVEISVFLLVALGLTIGVVSGFVGVGGGFFMTPALIVLDFPAHFAVGTSLMWIVGGSIIGILRHGRMGNIDFKLGLIITISAMAGMELGVRLLNWAKVSGLTDEAVLIVSVVMLLAVGTYTLTESLRTMSNLNRLVPNDTISTKKANPLARWIQGISLPPRLYLEKAGASISLWVILVIGFFVGVLAGFIGVGGGFLMVPSLVYLIGVPSYTAVGTGFMFTFSAAYGSIRQIMSGNVIIFASFLMLLGSSIGLQFGALVTRYVRGICMRFVLGGATLIAAIGAIFKLSGIFTEGALSWLDIGSVVVTFLGLGLAVLVILALFYVGRRYRKNQPVPVWMRLLVVDRAG